jgi:hypothetical protein
LSANNLLFFKNLKVATTPKQTMFMFRWFPSPHLRIIPWRLISFGISQQQQTGYAPGEFYDERTIHKRIHTRRARLRHARRMGAARGDLARLAA